MKPEFTGSTPLNFAVEVLLLNILPPMLCFPAQHYWSRYILYTLPTPIPATR